MANDMLYFKFTYASIYWTRLMDKVLYQKSGIQKVHMIDFLKEKSVNEII